jgi:hypothetical protein
MIRIAGILSVVRGVLQCSVPNTLSFALGIPTPLDLVRGRGTAVQEA